MLPSLKYINLVYANKNRLKQSRNSQKLNNTLNKIKNQLKP